VLLESGYLGASARAIAQRAGVATGSVHYYFSSVEELLLASLERATAQRLQEYRQLRDDADDLQVLLGRVADELAADREAGRFRLLAQLMAGAATSGPMAAAVADATEPWLELTKETIERFVGPQPFGVISSADIALGLVALFVGLELLDHVDRNRFDATGLVERAAHLGQLLAGSMTAGTSGAP
jgi:AcrR family transcriptional regulator